MSDRWGWYLVVDAIAEGGRFQHPGLTPLHSAQSAAFYEAMLWYAKQKDCNEQQARLNQPDA